MQLIMDDKDQAAPDDFIGNQSILAKIDEDEELDSKSNFGSFHDVNRSHSLKRTDAKKKKKKKIKKREFGDGQKLPSLGPMPKPFNWRKTRKAKTRSVSGSN